MGWVIVVVLLLIAIKFRASSGKTFTNGLIINTDANQHATPILSQVDRQGNIHMKKSNSQKAFRRTLLALVLGIGLPLFVFTIATVLANRSAPVVKSAAPTSTEQAGPYTIALSIAPTPPQAIQFAHLTLRLTETSTQQTITDAGVQIRGLMESMDMAMGPFFANAQNDGVY